jgi:energy-coupling factor transporter ATP-binding protein EcfA2
MIEIDCISKWYGKRRVLTDCSTRVAKGEIVVVCGPSGSGKSTLIKCVNGLEPIQGGTVAQVMTPEVLVMTAHSVCRPYVRKEKPDGTIEERNARLPRNLAVMYLEWRGAWNLPPLNGIASAPMLTGDGAIHSAEGYEPATGMWRENVPDLSGLIPENPTDTEAAAALRLIRETFKTFCFADAETLFDPTSGIELVDTSTPPGRDESGFLAALMTAVCRPSLHLAPGVLLRAAPMSGAGAGKGLLARCISIVAFGREPHAVTGGGGR